MARQFTTPIALPGDPTSALQATTKQYVDAADAAKVPTSRTITAGTGLTGGGDLSADRTLTVAYGTTSTTAAAGDHTHSYVPTTQRGPIGGVQTLTYSATIAVDASLGVHFRLAATGDPTISVPTSGTDGQRLLFEITATGARTITFHASYELGGVVTSRTVAIASGLTGYVGVVNRNGTYRLLAVDPGS